jgi:hypothetical protein
MPGVALSLGVRVSDSTVAGRQPTHRLIALPSKHAFLAFWLIVSLLSSQHEVNHAYGVHG